MAEKLEIADIADLEAWLKKHVDGFEGPIRISKFSGGQSNPTYLLEARSANYVLRSKPPGDLLKSAHQVDREYRVMEALYGSPVPVPRVFALSDDGAPIGRMFFIMEHLDGQIFWDPAIPTLSASQRGRIYDRMNEAMAALHDLDYHAAGLADFGKPGNYFERQLTRWYQQYAASEIDRNEDIHRLMNWLAANMPPDDGQVALVHGDFRLDNIIFDNKGDHVLGLIDWELSTLGHPLADLAYQCMQWRLPHEGGFRGLGGLDRQSLGIPSEKSYVTAYCRRREIGEIDNWHFYVAFCFFRLAAILQGVYKRAIDGNATNPEKARQYGKAVPVLGQMAIEMITAEGTATKS